MPFSFNPVILLLTAAALFCLLWAIKLLISRTRLKTLHDEMEGRIAQSEQTITALRAQIDQGVRELNQSRAETQQQLTDFIRVKSDLNAANLRISELLNEGQSLKYSNEQLNKEKTELLKQNAELQASLNAQHKLMQQQQEREALARSELEQRLTALGERMLKERGEALNKTGSEQLKNTVSPLTQELKAFRDALTLAQKMSSEQAGSMKTELQKLQQAQLNLSKQADDLTRALTAGGKSQGMWGEHQLEICLNNAGLVEERDYVREYSMDTDDQRARPDAVLFLPNKHCLIIDAKCSLTAYTKAMSAETDKERESCLKQHLNSVRAHVDELSKKQYESFASLNSPSFVFMFVPIDQALTAALMADEDLYNYAAQKNVYLVSPSTLLPALRVTSNLWLLASQNEKVREIALQAQRIYKKLELVNEAFEDVLKSENTLQKSLNTMQTRLNAGRGNLTNMLSTFAYKAPRAVQAAGIDIDLAAASQVDDDAPMDQDPMLGQSVYKTRELKSAGPDEGKPAALPLNDGADGAADISSRTPGNDE